MPRGKRKGSISRARRLPARDIRPVLKRIQHDLKKLGLSGARLPSNDLIVQVVSRNLEKWLNWEKVIEWEGDWLKMSGG